MSPRAAWRLESLGFPEVYDYAAGKADWFAYGLPGEGRDVTIPRAGDVARRDVPTCGLDERIGQVVERVRSAGCDQCVVVNAERVVLGGLDDDALEAAPETLAEEIMKSGPATTRPDARLDAIRDRLRRSPILVTTPDGAAHRGAAPR